MHDAIPLRGSSAHHTQVQPDVPMHASIGISGHFFEVDPAWENVLGWSSSELLATPFNERVHPDDLDTMVAAIHHLYKSGDPVTFRSRFRRKDGTYVRLTWHARFDANLFMLKVTAQVSDTARPSGGEVYRASG